VKIRPRNASSLLVSFVSLSFAACGGRAPETPAGTVYDASTTARATEPGVASIQDVIARRRASHEIDTTAPDWRNGHVPLRPKATFDPARDYVWTVETSEGRIRTLLRAASAPEHVANLVYLTLLGFYDGLPICGIVPGKAVLGGCPVGDGRGSPGYAFGGLPEVASAHDREGLLSSVSLGPGTEDSKFRWTLGPDRSLDERSTVYGEVVEGIDVLRRIGAIPVDDTGRPSRVVTIRRASLLIR
jgi:peptidyl-prolyl cis-trans isomerase A (cyclophilin A)/peptidyl-prolyl cis-trans isomerase-like 1